MLLHQFFNQYNDTRRRSRRRPQNREVMLGFLRWS
jgi:hypothetical protein